MLLTLLLLLQAVPPIAHASREDGAAQLVRIELAPTSNGSWLVWVEARGLVSAHCNGTLEANPYYLETRAVSSRLAVAPLYYVVDSACPGLPARLATILGAVHANVTLSIMVAGEECRVVTSDGAVGRNVSAYISSNVFVDRILHDGVALVCPPYRGWVLEGLLIVSEDAPPRGFASAARCVTGVLTRLLGRDFEPRVVVLASPGEHQLLLPGSGFSLGRIVYIQLEHGWDARGIVSVFAHEAVHAWLGRGPVRGDRLLVEGAAQLAGLLALEHCAPGAAESFRRISVGEYGSLLAIHKALRDAGLSACSRDLYFETLRRMVARGGSYSLLDLVAGMYKLAERLGCSGRFEEELGRSIIAVSISESGSGGLAPTRSSGGSMLPAVKADDGTHGHRCSAVSGSTRSVVAASLHANTSGSGVDEHVSMSATFFAVALVALASALAAVKLSRRPNIGGGRKF